MLPGVRGETGRLTGLEVLEAFEKLGCSGTLVLEQNGNILIIALEAGQLAANHKLGRLNALDSNELRFHFDPHEPGEYPMVQSRFPHSILGTLRALPDLGSFTPLPYSRDLRALILHLRSEGFTGCLCLETTLGQSAVLFLEGKLAAALFEEDGQIRERSDALRAVQRAHLGDPEAKLYLRELPLQLIAGLLGLIYSEATDLQVGFTGLESAVQGYTFFEQGQAVLQVRAELRGHSGYYPQCTEPPDLTLPDEPPGWEYRRYRLTLRGRDALNAMTDLGLEFRQRHGTPGRRMLEKLEQGHTLEDVAQLLGVELSKMKTRLEALEDEGLIQHVQDS